MPVISIDQSRDDGHCVIDTEGGASFHCKRVIVSIPSTLYHKIDFKPTLPEGKAILSDNTAAGYYSKMIYVFKEPWWQKAGFSGVLDSDKGPIIFTRDTSIPIDDQWSITCFLVGDKGRDWSKLPRASRHQKAWAQFSESFGKFVDVPAPTKSLETEWAKEAHFLGAPCPVTIPGVLTKIGGQLANPVGRVAFRRHRDLSPVAWVHGGRCPLWPAWRRRGGRGITGRGCCSPVR
jgi:monoamine oxidase